MQDTSSERIWSAFAYDEKLDQRQLALFKKYYAMLMDWNERMNLTAITDLEAVIFDHFKDALSIRAFDCIKPGMTLCDVGSGCGVPGIPIGIVRCDIQIVLLEVNQKKISFLRAVIAALELSHVTICDMDWLTFIHTAPLHIDIFCARASIKPELLVRIFQKTCLYRTSLVVYWASRVWCVGEKERPFYIQDNWYTLKNKTRRLAFFKDVQDKKHSICKS